MHVTCNQSDIQTALNLAHRITAKNLSLPVLAYVLLEAKEDKIFVRSTNLQVGVEFVIPAEVQEEGVVAVKGDLFGSVFGSAQQTSTVTLEVGDNDEVSVHIGNSNSMLRSHESDDFPSLPTVAEGINVTISAKVFIEGVKSVLYAASTSEIKPELASLYLYQDNDQLVFVATDSFWLAEKKITVSNSTVNQDFTGVMLPVKNLQHILRVIQEYPKGDLRLCVGESQVDIVGDFGFCTSRITDGVFPDYRQILPKEKNTSVMLLKSELAQALKLSSVFLSNFKKLDLTIDNDKQSMTLVTQNQDIGATTTALEVKAEGESLSMSINQKYLQDAFQSISQDGIEFSFVSDRKPLILRGYHDETFTYLIMPMNR